MFEILTSENKGLGDYALLNGFTRFEWDTIGRQKTAFEWSWKDPRIGFPLKRILSTETDRNGFSSPVFSGINNTLFRLLYYWFSELSIKLQIYSAIIEINCVGRYLFAKAFSIPGLSSVAKRL